MSIELKSNSARLVFDLDATIGKLVIASRDDAVALPLVLEKAEVDKLAAYLTSRKGASGASGGFG